MPTWLVSNIATILIALCVLAAVFFAIRALIKSKRQGKASCGSCCAHCALAGKCHGGAETKPKKHTAQSARTGAAEKADGEQRRKNQESL